MLFPKILFLTGISIKDIGIDPTIISIEISGKTGTFLN